MLSTSIAHALEFLSFRIFLILFFNEMEEEEDPEEGNRRNGKQTLRKHLYFDTRFAPQHLCTNYIILINIINIIIIINIIKYTLLILF
jgi:hypothetical protein